MVVLVIGDKEEECWLLGVLVVLLVERVAHLVLARLDWLLQKLQLKLPWTFPCGGTKKMSQASVDILRSAGEIPNLLLLCSSLLIQKKH